MRVFSPVNSLRVSRIILAFCVFLVVAEVGQLSLRFSVPRWNVILSAARRSQILLSSLPLSPRHGFLASRSAAPQIKVLRASTPLILARSGAEIQIQTNFEVRSPVLQDNVLTLYLMNAQGKIVADVQNNLNNDRTILPTSEWVGPITILSTLAPPDLAAGTYAILLDLSGPAGLLRLTPGPGVTQDESLRYGIGTLKVDASAPPPDLLPAPTLDLKGFHLTLDESFSELSISDSATNDDARWYARNEQCCMATTDNTDTAMAGILSPQNPFSRNPGGGLNIRLQRSANSWTSGVLTSVDSSGVGFSQQYGYFEMKARFPPGENTWPAFWLLDSASKIGHTSPRGEIDIVEYIANSGFSNTIATILHDWSSNTAPAASHYQVPLPTAGFHTYGMMWTATTTTFYFDGAVTLRTPTPSIMKQPYYLLVDLGIGSGYPTDKTPFVNDMQVAYIRAYSMN